MLFIEVPNTLMKMHLFYKATYLDLNIFIQSSKNHLDKLWWMCIKNKTESTKLRPSFPKIKQNLCDVLQHLKLP